MRDWRLDLGRDPWTRLELGGIRGWLFGPHGSPDPPDTGPLQVLAKLRGAHSRRFPKKSLQLDFTADPLADAPPDGHSIRRLHLNADYVDPTLMRSALSMALFAELGAPAPQCRHVSLTVSGEFAGLYVAIESVDRDFCRRRGWAPGLIFYAVSRNANFGLISPFTRQLKVPLERGYLAVDRADTAPLGQMLTDLNLASDRTFGRVAERWVDVEGYLRWLIVAVFVGNRDGFVHNYALYLDPVAERFRIIPWDYDATWGIDIHGRPSRLDRVPVTGWNKLTRRLLEVPGYLQRYRRLFQKALDGPLAPDQIRGRVERLRAEIEPSALLDRQKWGDPLQYATDVTQLHTWAEKRRALLREALTRL